MVNIGLNGVLVTETQSTRTFTLHAEDWAKPITQPIYVVGEVESNSPTMHPSAPLLVEVVGNKETASVSPDKEGDRRSRSDTTHTSPDSTLITSSRGG